MKNNYGIGDIVYDSLLKKHYMIEGLGWKKSTIRAYKTYCLETGACGMYSVYNLNRYDFIKKVA